MAKKKAESEAAEPEEVVEAVEVVEPAVEECTCLATERAGLKMPCASCVAKGLGAFGEKR